MRKQLERFLSWLLDARWFPETPRNEKKKLKEELKKLRRVIARMEAFRKEIPDARLRRGLEEWQNYESTLVALLKQSSRAAPHLSIRGFARGFPEIAERLMCAVLIIRKLHPDVSAYEEVQRLLANPRLLPDPVRVSEEAIRELRAGTIQRPITWSEWNYLKEGRDIPMRRYTRT